MTGGGQAARVPLPGFSELDEIVAAYRPLPGVPDEFIDAEGKPRPAWLTFISRLIELGQDEIQRRFSVADRQIRDTGMSYRVYGDGSERSWPIGHLPLLIDADDWRDIAAGVVQRAELLERVLQDVYGEGRLIASGALPAAAVAGCRDYLQPAHGVVKPGQPYLHLYAAELGRGPDGKWWVLGDRTQAPSGTGYALANRLILSRTFPNLYREMNVERLAPFFDAFRAGLAARADRSGPRLCLLTPGPYNETYFEQAYLARYLGLLLVEGDDLTVRDGILNVRTIAGLKRADVVLRRIDSDFADPLELNGRSRLGVPGLLDVLRAGGTVFANAIGAGVVESRVMLSFMPKLCQQILGEDLRIPNIATWWCGQERECATVLANMDELALAGAFGNAVPGGKPYQSVIGAEMSAEEKAAFRRAVATRRIDYIGQEVVKLSTTPAYKDGLIAPRPFTLRVYAARTPDGWMVMPGGFCRVSHRPDARAVTMDLNAESTDVWVLGTAPVAHSTLLPIEEENRVRRLLGNLPSRAADNLFWFGRYLERAEAVLRIIRALSARLIETTTQLPDSTWTLERLKELLDSAGALPEETQSQGTALAAIALFGKDEFGSAFNLVYDARRAASFIRERLSSDTWRLIQDAYEGLDREMSESITEWDISDRVEASLRTLTSISGLCQENMNRGAGWVMLDMGRRVERAINTCRFAHELANKNGRADGLSVLLDLIDSQITYRSRYLVGVSLPLVRDMVLLDPFNPRSVAFQVDRLNEHLAHLPRLREDGLLEEPRRLAVQLQSDLTASIATDLDNEVISGIEDRLLLLAEKIAARYFLQGANALRAEKPVNLA
jgi:uncharacterized circularly permuted ATP-grasp superfamily protein/uncharacterized alpha-E superfamily protein